jgi:hypothetical protein
MQRAASQNDSARLSFNAACIAIDIILEEMYSPKEDQNNLRTQIRRRALLQKHKKIGKR